MTTYTRADLVTKVLENLGVLHAGQAATPEDSARVNGNLPALIAQLARREVVYIGDLEDIEEEFFLPLADIAAYELRNEFGLMGEGLVEVKSANDIAIGKFQVMQRGRPTYAPLAFSSI